jgi:hypothetical protein
VEAAARSKTRGVSGGGEAEEEEEEAGYIEYISRGGSEPNMPPQIDL